MDIKDVEASIRQADTLFKVGRLSEAKPLYESALVCFESVYQQGHPDITYCMQQLGDTAYLLGDNDEAFAAFMRLLQMREKQASGVNPSDLVINLFKLAKCCERMDRLDDADALYTRALAEGEKSLFAGHPLLGAVMEGQAIMLKRAKRKPEIAAKLAQRAREIKEMAGDLSKMPDNIAEALRLNTYEDEGALEEVEKEEAKEAEMAVARETLKRMLVKFKKIAIVAVLLVLVGAGIVYALNQARVASENAAQREIVRKFSGDGKEFIAADGVDRLKFSPDGNVESIIDGVKRTVPFKVAPVSVGFATAVPSERSYKEVPEGLLGDKGRIFWKTDAPELSTIARVRAIADAVQKYYQEKNEYPTDLTDILQADEKLTTNTISHEKDEVPLIDAGRERDWDPEQAAQRTKTEATLESGAMLPDETELAPGAIHCYYLKSGDPYVGTAVKGFFMRIGGANGQMMSGQSADRVLVIALKNGRNDPFLEVHEPRAATDQDAHITAIRVLEAK